MAPASKEIPTMEKHEVVISGISGLFPECDDMDEFTKCLFSQEDVITTDARRWLPGLLGVPPGVGKIKQKDLFDYGFLGFTRQLGKITDSTTRLSIEQAFRAVADAGMNVKELRGSNTAVFMGAFTSETEDLFLSSQNQGKNGLIAHSRTMQANRISFFLNLKGPSVAVDATWNGGMECIERAYDMIANGSCTGAIVGSCSLMFAPHISHHYKAMGKLSEDSVTRSFSADANGYARSEGCVVLFLQRADLAKRSYGTILGIKALTYGSKLESFSEFSKASYKKMLKEVYAEANVDPSELAFLEAYGAASKVVDARELNAIAEVLLPKRQKPLLIGSVKSNVGHTEAASSLVALAKALVAFETGIIPPNINYSSPNPDVPALVSGKLQVVTEPVKLEGDIIGISSVGIAGPYAHMIVKKNAKTKKPLLLKELPPDGLPRLVTMTDRNPDNIIKNKTRLDNMPIDVEFVTLMNNFAKEEVRNHLCRGFTVLNGTPNSYNQVEPYSSGAERLPIWFIFSGMGSQWPGMAKSLMRIPVFSQAIHECHNILLRRDLNLLDAVTNEDPKVFDNVLNAFVGIAAVQIALVDVLRSIGVEPDGIIGHSLGEQGCGYADRCFTKEQMILSAYARGKASLDAGLIKGMMAAVGKGYEQMKHRLPENVEIACHNSKDSCTVSGPVKEVGAFIETLKAEGTFAKMVNVGDIAFHSKYMKPAGELLVKHLGEVIPEPKRRSSKWISSSSPESKWNTELAQFCSAEYHANNMLSPVLFEEATAHIPEDAIIIEIAPHALLQAILKRSFPKAKHVPLTSRFDDDGLCFLLAAIGKLYSCGVPMEVGNLYPPVEFPVSRGTPFLSSFVGWQHNEELKFVSMKSQPPFYWRLDLSEEYFSKLLNHKLGGNPTIPDSFYLEQLITQFTESKKLSAASVVIENLKFENSCQVSFKSKTEVVIKLNPGCGIFCVSDGQSGENLAQGTITLLDPRNLNLNSCAVTMDDNVEGAIDGSHVISLFKYQGLELTGGFASIKRIFIEEHSIRGLITFTGSITEFLNAAFLIVGFFEARDTCELLLMKEARELAIDPSAFLLLNGCDIMVEYDSRARTLHGAHFRVLVPRVKPALLKTLQEVTQISSEVIQFVPFYEAQVSSAASLLEICAQLLLENVNLSQSAIVRMVVIGSEFADDVKKMVGKAKYYDKLTYQHFESESELLESDRSTLHQDIVCIVTSTTLQATLIQAFHSTLKCFFLGPRLNNNNNTQFSRTTEISSFKLNDTEYQLLCTPLNNDNVDCQVVCYNEEDIISLGQKLAAAHDRNLQENDDNHVVVLQATVSSVSSALKILDETCKLQHTYALRYLFSDTPDDDNDDQINKQLKFNLKLKGKWGSLRTLPPEAKEINIVNDVYSQAPTYPLSCVVSSKDIYSIGLNLNDVTGSVESDGISGFDFATLTEIGVGRYDPVAKRFIKDDIFVWKRLPKWTDVEAAGVPVLYALASYIVHIVDNAIKGNSILINQGLLPVSQAITALALEENLTTYVSVFGAHEKQRILELFPDLRPENVFDCSVTSFYVDVLRVTKGEGVSKVVNTFKDDRMIEPCVKCTGRLGAFIQLSLAPMIENSHIGMLFFVTEVVALGVTIDVLLNLPVDVKIRIKEFMQKAIDKGRVRPFANPLVLPPHVNDEEVVRVLGRVKTKVVVDLRERADSDSAKLFVCDSSLNYIIVSGQPQTDIWLKLSEWLLRRGARNVSVVLKQPHVSPTLALRLKTVNGKYPTSKIVLHSAQRLSSETGMKDILDELSTSAKISTVFLLNSAIKEYSSALDQVLQDKGVNYCLICLGSGGDRLCERRQKENMTSLSVRCTPSSLDASNFLQRLDELIINAKTNTIVTLTPYSIAKRVSDNKPGSEWDHVPSSLPELHELFRLRSSKPTFIEVQSHTFRRELTKEIYPVFIIPSLRLHRTRRIAQTLYYPAYVACLPDSNQDIDFIASELATQMAAFPQNMYTLIADDWGGTLALHIASKLQVLGKFATVLMLNAAPTVTRYWIDKLLKDDLTLLKKYIKLSPQDLSRIKELPTFENKIDSIVENSTQKEETLLTVQSVVLLRNRLRAVQNATPPTKKIKVPCHLFRCKDASCFDQCGLEDYLQRKAVVYIKDAETTSELLDHVEEDINVLTLFEYKDAAFTPEESSIGTGFLSEDIIPPSAISVAW